MSNIFPFGSNSDESKSIIEAAGFTYTRGVMSTKKYKVPKNFLKLQPTCAHHEKHVLSLLDEFVQVQMEQDMLFYVWGHGYEMDFNTETSSYEHLKRIFDKVAGREDIICCSNSEVVRRTQK